MTNVSAPDPVETILAYHRRTKHHLSRYAAGSERLARSLPPHCFLVGLTSVHWREGWKYGVRAYRYCQHDIGHASAAVRFAAATVGWSALLLDHLADDDVAAWLGLNRAADFPVHPLDRAHPR